MSDETCKLCGFSEAFCTAEVCRGAVERRLRSDLDRARQDLGDATADARILAHAFKHDTQPPRDVVRRSLNRVMPAPATPETAPPGQPLREGRTATPARTLIHEAIAHADAMGCCNLPACAFHGVIDTMLCNELVAMLEADRKQQ